MYKGKLIELREYKKEDVKLAKEYVNNWEIAKNLAPGIPYPYTLEDEEKWYESNSSVRSDNVYNFAIEALDNGEYIGGCGINSVNWKNSIAEVGIFIGNQEYHNRGYGTDAMLVLINFIFNQMNLNKIKLNVYSYNNRAIKCYEKCGFKKEGILREELFRNGQYHDIIIMGILKGEFKLIQNEIMDNKED